jgi:hypothetical protein
VALVTLGGDHGDGFLLIRSLLATEAWLEERGWDAPPLVLALLPRSDGGLPPSEEPSDQTLLLYEVIGEGEPYEILANTNKPNALALLVAVEGWSLPQDLDGAARQGRPSEHADRVEVRTVLAMTREGEVLSVTRERGREPLVEAGASGPLVDAMRLALRSSE